RLPELLLELLHGLLDVPKPGDVAGAQDDAADGGGLRPVRPDGLEDSPRAVPVAEAERHGRSGAEPGEDLVQPVLDPGNVVGMDGEERVSADHVLGGMPDGPRRGRAGVENRPIGIDDRDDIPGRLDDGAKQIDADDFIVPGHKAFSGGGGKRRASTWWNSRTNWVLEIRPSARDLSATALRKGAASRVMMTTRPAPWRDRILRAASKPSMPGMTRSMRTRSGATFFSTSMASS